MLDTITATDSQIRDLLEQQARQTDDLEWAACEAVAANEGSRRDGRVVNMGEAQFEQVVDVKDLSVTDGVDPDGRIGLGGRDNPVVASVPAGSAGNPIVVDE